MSGHTLVIVTCNRLPMLKDCIQAASAQTLPYDHVIVVDNASTDGTREYLKGFEKDPAFILILQDRNTGGAGGFETGLRQAVRLDTDWITLIDDDCILRGNFLEEIQEAIRRTDGKYAAFAGVPLTDGIRIGHRRRVRGRLLKKEICVPVCEYEKESFACDLASFCGLVVSKAAVGQVGFPRADFFIWYDDTEYCLRLSGLTPILNWNGAVIDHRAKTGPAQLKAGWKDYYGIRNRLIVTRLHYNGFTLTAVVLKKLVRVLLEGSRLILHGQPGEVPWQFRLYFDAIRDGLAGRTGYCSRYAPGGSLGTKGAKK